MGCLGISGSSAHSKFCRRFRPIYRPSQCHVSSIFPSFSSGIGPSSHLSTSNRSTSLGAVRQLAGSECGFFRWISSMIWAAKFANRTIGYMVIFICCFFSWKLGSNTSFGGFRRLKSCLNWYDIMMYIYNIYITTYIYGDLILVGNNYDIIGNSSTRIGGFGEKPFLIKMATGGLTHNNVNLNQT